MHLTADSQAILMLCSYLGLPSNPDPAPLTLREWNAIARNLVAASLRPEALLDRSASEVASMLDLPIDYAERMAYLLDRGGSIAIELERLTSLGIWVWTRADNNYPEKYRQRLKESAPVVLFGAGDQFLPGQPGIALVGSRNVDQAGQEIADFVGSACAHHGLVVYSGGARGVDTFSMKAALEGRGSSVGVLAHSLEKTIRKPEFRVALGQGNLTLLTPYSPSAGFNVGTAMGRNKLIYTLADYALIIASDANKGGTWTGALEAIKHHWIPIFVVDGPNVPEGNRLLIEKGCLSFPSPFPVPVDDFKSWIQEQAAKYKYPPTQLNLM